MYTIHLLYMFFSNYFLTLYSTFVRNVSIQVHNLITNMYRFYLFIFMFSRYFFRGKIWGPISEVNILYNMYQLVLYYEIKICV